MCFQRSGIARSTWDPKFRITTIYFIPPNVQVKSAGFRQIPGRAGGPIFQKPAAKVQDRNAPFGSPRVSLGSGENPVDSIFRLV